MIQAENRSESEHSNSHSMETEPLQQPPPLRPTNSSPQELGQEGEGQGQEQAHALALDRECADANRLAAPLPLPVDSALTSVRIAKDIPAPSLQSPGIKVEFHGGDHAHAAGDTVRPPLTPHPR